MNELRERIPSSVVNLYHRQLVDGLTQYQCLRHNLDFNFDVLTIPDSAANPLALSSGCTRSIKQKIKDLIEKINSEHYPKVTLNEFALDGNLDGILKDYSQMIS